MRRWALRIGAGLGVAFTGWAGWAILAADARKDKRIQRIQAQVDKTIQRNGRRDCCSDPDPRVFLTNPPHAKCLNCGRSVERTTL